MDLPHDQIEAFLEAAPDALVIVDSIGKIAFVNERAEALFDYRRDELLGREIELLLPERLRGHHATHMARYFKVPRRRAGRELLGRRKDGTEFAVEISLSPVVTDRGTFVSSTIRDAAGRKDAERELVEAREVAECANRAKSAFLAAASHDLRQPLQTLTLLSSVLGRVVPTGSAAAAAVANQSEALHLMAGLVNSLLDVSKLEAGVVKPDITDCSVAEIFAGLKAEFGALAEAKGLELIVEDCEQFVRTDAALLGRIVQNLLANAVRYTRAGWVRLRGIVSAETVRIEVADTGVGIPADDLDLIFGEYYQTSRDLRESRDGVGLGLAIARRTATLLGCSLEVTSTIGRGSCFALGVPRGSVSAARGRIAPRKSYASGANRALVLIIDDDPAVADATALLLTCAGFGAITASSSAQAVHRMADRAATPDLLICDFHLGGTETGIGAIRALRAATRPGLPAILVSGDTSSDLRRNSGEIEGCRILTKPVDADELLDLVASLVPPAGCGTAESQLAP